MSELRKLARRIYDLTRHQVWLGGTAEWRNPGANWPKGVEKIDWSNGVTWTLSPEVELGGLRLRVCISWDGNTDPINGTHKVRIFVDGELKYPGGWYDGTNRKGIMFTHRDAWSWKIARIERRDGGKTGRVSARRELLTEAQDRLKSVTTSHTPEHICPRCGFDGLEDLDLLEDEEYGQED